VENLKRILFIEPQPCIRALKLAYGLKWLLGEEISLVFGHQGKTLTEFYGYGDEFFDEFVLLSKEEPEKSISELVKRYNPDIIHSHNAPDYLTLAALNSVKGTPIIHDTHDALTMRKTPYNLTDGEDRVNQYAVEEKVANEKSQGRIYITKGVRDYLRNLYSLDSGSEIIFNNYVPKAIIPQKLEKKLSSTDGETHIVYAGTITIPAPTGPRFLSTWLVSLPRVCLDEACILRHTLPDPETFPVELALQLSPYKPVFPRLS